MVLFIAVKFKTMLILTCSGELSLLSGVWARPLTVRAGYMSMIMAVHGFFAQNLLQPLKRVSVGSLLFNCTRYSQENFCVTNFGADIIRMALNV